MAQGAVHDEKTLTAIAAIDLRIARLRDSIDDLQRAKLNLKRSNYEIESGDETKWPDDQDLYLIIGNYVDGHEGTVTIVDVMKHLEGLGIKPERLRVRHVQLRPFVVLG